MLGGCAAWPEPGRACSGFLVTAAGARIVIDLGYGTLPRLLAALGSVVGEGLDAVVITHEHADHCADLHALFRARRYSGLTTAQIPLFSPWAVVERLAGMEDSDPADITSVFEWRDVAAGPHHLGNLQLESRRLPHHVPNWGIRLTAPDWTLAYTGDTGADPALSELGRDADLFIVDATDHHQAAATPDERFNLGARSAARAARDANAQRLMLTHFWPGNDRELALQRASRYFDGQILTAEEELEVRLSPHR